MRSKTIFLSFVLLLLPPYESTANTKIQPTPPVVSPFIVAEPIFWDDLSSLVHIAPVKLADFLTKTMDKNIKQ